MLEEGEKTRTCSLCKNTETAVVSKLKPTWKISAKKLSVYEGESSKAIVVSGLANGDAVIKWSSSNKKVAAVSSDGVVRGIRSGTANIRVALRSGMTMTVKVKVLSKTEKESTEETKESTENSKTKKKQIKAKAIKGLKKKLTVRKGKTVTLKPKLKPKNSTDKIKYKSSNKKIVTVNSKGVVKGKKVGKAKVTVTAGKAKFVITVTVKK